MTRAEIITGNFKQAEEGMTRIKKLLARLDIDLRYSTIVYSRMVLRGVRNIEVDVSGKSQIEVDKFYKMDEG